MRLVQEVLAVGGLVRISTETAGLVALLILTQSVVAVRAEQEREALVVRELTI